MIQQILCGNASLIVVSTHHSADVTVSDIYKSLCHYYRIVCRIILINVKLTLINYVNITPRK